MACDERKRRTKKERVKTGKGGIAAETRRAQRHESAGRGVQGIQQWVERVVRMTRVAEGFCWRDGTSEYADGRIRVKRWARHRAHRGAQRKAETRAGSETPV